jgi:mannose/fructose/N-acetylgalactosamine-specific phosphotransferase system component IIC
VVDTIVVAPSIAAEARLVVEDSVVAVVVVAVPVAAAVVVVAVVVVAVVDIVVAERRMPACQLSMRHLRPHNRRTAVADTVVEDIVAVVVVVVVVVVEVVENVVELAIVDKGLDKRAAVVAVVGQMSTLVRQKDWQLQQSTAQTTMLSPALSMLA